MDKPLVPEVLDGDTMFEDRFLCGVRDGELAVVGLDLGILTSRKTANSPVDRNT